MRNGKRPTRPGRRDVPGGHVMREADHEVGEGCDAGGAEAPVPAAPPKLHQREGVPEGHAVPRSAGATMPTSALNTILAKADVLARGEKVMLVGKKT